MSFSSKDNILKKASAGRATTPKKKLYVRSLLYKFVTTKFKIGINLSIIKIFGQFFEVSAGNTNASGGPRV